MEKRIQQRINNYIYDFKTKICNEFNCKELNDMIKNYPNLELSNEDFQKRKRVKNNIPNNNRCCAKKSGGEQCTRRKKDNEMYCGTHTKNRPYGVVDLENETQNKVITVSTVEINGIVYYKDNENNIYDPNDIVKDVKNPNIIGKYSFVNGEHILAQI